jgi:hypothetical protein
VTRKGGTISAEAAENQLNVFIERRAQQTRDANWRAKAWSADFRSYNLRQAAKRRREWIEFHRGLEQLHSKLALEHAEAAKCLEAEGAALA